MLFQIAVLFLLGVVLIAVISFFALDSLSEKYVRDQLSIRERGTAQDLVRYINEFPGHRWLLNYWYEHWNDIDIEYDTDYTQENETRKKYRLLMTHHPELDAEYATDEDLEALPPEDQELYAEVIYSWLMTRCDSMARANDLDFLFCVSAQEPYDKQFVIFMTGRKERERGTENGKYYPIGTVIPASRQQTDAMRLTVNGTPGFAINSDGKFMDYYYLMDTCDDHAFLVGLSRNYAATRSDVISSVKEFGKMFIIFLIALALVCLMMILVVILKPLEMVQENIRLYKNTKDSETVIKNLAKVESNNEIGELSDDVADLTREIDEYTDQIKRITSERERIETELSLAGRIQMAMLPGGNPAFPDRTEFDICGSMTPAREVGGDFYDFFLTDDRHLAMLIADVSGKSIPAALFMMAAKISVSHHSKKRRGPAEILEKVNNSIVRNNPEEMFVTAWLGILDLDTGVLQAVNAGHECPMLMEPGEYFELVDDRHGFVLGADPDVTYHEYTLQMKPGSKLFLYTDGLIEAVNKHDQMFETYRVLAALNRARDETPEKILERVKEEQAAFVGGGPPFDDLAMLCLHYISPRPEIEKSGEDADIDS